MKKFLELLKKENELKIIEEEVDVDLEIGHISYIEVKKENSKALLFTNPVKDGKKFNFPVLTNLFGSEKRLELIFKRKISDIANEIQKFLHLKPPSNFFDKISILKDLFSLKNIFPKKLNTKGKCQEIVYLNEDIDLYNLPILKTWEGDGGPFITMSQVYTKSLDGTMFNLGMYRLQVYSKNKLGLHWQIHKDSSCFFDQYKKAGVKMPVTICIGGDPLYAWCGQAPLPYGVNELLLYGFIRNKPVELVKSLSNDIFIPSDVDFVLEGYVDTNKLEIEGPFGDHTGYYTLKELYPVLELSVLSHKKEAVFNATVVGKPPLEDKYMGFATSLIFLPLLKTTMPFLLDYYMPENGVFHNLIIAKIDIMYKGHAKQAMHTFWGVGQMSFVKHAIFVNKDAPDLRDAKNLSDYILNRLNSKCILITEGIVDALDHSSSENLVGGKLGIDCSNEVLKKPNCTLLSDEDLFAKVKELSKSVKNLKQYKINTNNPICILAVRKTKSQKKLIKKMKKLSKYIAILIIIDDEKNDVNNPYMLVWRVSNNIDAMRDIYIYDDFIALDATNKSELDGFTREWPGDVECTKEVIKDLKNRNLIDIDEKFIEKFQL